LRWQVCLSSFEPDERAAAEWIIQDMDENGYLLYPPSELSAVSGLPIELLERALKKIRGLTPQGRRQRSKRVHPSPV
jgi:DNA-directed RNA polymerase specialized sigma54-like protein